MDFYDSYDRLNRAAPYAFQWDHLLFVIIGIKTYFINKKTLKEEEEMKI